MGLDKENNTTLGFRKSRPLNCNALRAEPVPVQLFLDARPVARPAWLNAFKLSLHDALVLDRHYLRAIEHCVPIGRVQDRADSRSPVDGLALVLAERYDNALQFRELPCSLSRLYFSGRLRFRRFVRQLSAWQVDECLRLIADDNFTPPPPDDPDDDEGAADDDEFLSPEHRARCALIEAYWRAVLELLFLSFESALGATLQRLERGQFLHVGLRDDMERDAFWHNFPRELPARDYDVLDAGRLLYLVCVWRLNTSLVLERVLRPWETPLCAEWLPYRLKLFRATHLDLLTAMLRDGCYDDAQLYQRGLLGAAYPGAARVCCAEEMPDLICYVTDNFKTGTNLKERKTRDDWFGHIFINKTSPNICKIRNSFDISIRYGEADPLIYEALKNVLRCVLLGHLPRAQGQVSALAACKINAFFSADEADRALTEEQFRELTRDKSLKRKKNGEPELEYVKTFFKLWMLLCRHLVMFLLKEFALYIAESSGCYDDVCAVNYKRQRGAEITRLGNARCRELLSRQASLTRPFDWSVIEYEKKSPHGQKAASAAGDVPRAYDVKSGEIKKFHHWSLKMASKINKDDFSKILIKKMTGTEKKITQEELARCDEFLAADDDPAPRCITRAQFRFLCWYMAQRKDTRIETRWFQVMGMTVRGLAQLRHWQFLFCEYGIPDNSLNPEIEAMRERSMRDTLLLKTALRLIEYFRVKQHLFHLPLQCAQRQVDAMRAQMRIDDYEPTPPHMGDVWQCKGCMRFACSVVQIEPSELGRQTAAPNTARKQAQAAQQAQGAPSPPPQQVTHSYLNKTFYNVENGRLYCMKNHNPYTRQALATEQPMTLVMRRRDETIRIYSNKQVAVRAPQDVAPAPRAFLFGDRYAREQTDKKLEWLMQASVRDMMQPERATDSDATTTTQATTTRKGTPAKKKDGVKKLIQQRIDDVITGPGADCQAPLMCVNIVGVVKNGKAACMQCGLLTDYGNRNLTPDGAITCGRHAPPPEPPDRLVAKFSMHPRDLVPLSDYLYCHYCAAQWSRYRITVQAPMFALVSLPLCKECFERCRARTKGDLVALQTLDHHMRK